MEHLLSVVNVLFALAGIVVIVLDELEIINNALNEVCNGIDLEGEFETRTGCTVEEARSVLEKVHALASN